jgi:uncharacterized protein
MIDEAVREKYKSLRSLVSGYGAVGVAFSGGVDSTFLARVSRDVLGDRAAAIIIDSEAYPPENIQDARGLASLIGIRLIEIPVRVCDIPEFVENAPERCYHCKRALFRIMLDHCLKLGLPVLIDGSNVDDLDDYRPGMRALFELGVRSPLQEAGFTKMEIRIFSGELGLPTWNRASFACLASRFPYGERITPELLERTWRAESVLRDLGIREYRVRNHGDTARIELDREGMALLIDDPDARKHVAAHLKPLGYRYVTLDIEGYRTGSMNEALPGKGV